MTLTIRDTTFSGDIVNEVDLRFTSEQVTVREIVTERVTQEVEAYNESQREGDFSGLIKPTDTERRLNGERANRRKPVDAERQVYVALDAFQKNGYFVLIDDQQAESLEQRVTLRADTEVSFIKLTPLIGG